MRASAAALALALMAAPVAAEPLAPTGRWPMSEAQAAAALARLVGQCATWRDGALEIDDIAGAGRPWIGRVERRGAGLWLVGPDFAWRLTGALARPRLAGPGYVVWVIGPRRGDAALQVVRLGVLARPS